ncbi:MAG: spermidine synthase [Deltaproteobacteria bacterium]|nr:spermidine synthase [Deltaproteobacteria bacterium]MBW2448206.1 spermidine synthase [Deltaproteobacteria bacterium]
MSNLEVLAYEKTPIGMIGLRRRELLAVPGTIVTEITLDHELLMSSYHTDSERALSTRALQVHPGDGLRTLVGGLGLGYTASELLRSPRVARVDVIEFLPQVIEWVREGLVPESAQIANDDRLHIIEADVYALLDGEPDRDYDLILIDVDHSPDERLGENNEGFYGEAGLRRTKRHLSQGGTLGVWSYEESPLFLATLRATFGSVVAEPVTFENLFTNETETNWVYLATDA